MAIWIITKSCNFYIFNALKPVHYFFSPLALASWQTAISSPWNQFVSNPPNHSVHKAVRHNFSQLWICSPSGPPHCCQNMKVLAWPSRPFKIGPPVYAARFTSLPLLYHSSTSLSSGICLSVPDAPQSLPGYSFSPFRSQPRHPVLHKSFLTLSLCPLSYRFSNQLGITHLPTCWLY